MARRVAARSGNRHRSVLPVQELTRDQLISLIDKRSRALLGISGDEFLRRYREGQIEYAPAEGPVIVLADLLTSS